MGHRLPHYHRKVKAVILIRRSHWKIPPGDIPTVIYVRAEKSSRYHYFSMTVTAPLQNRANLLLWEGTSKKEHLKLPWGNDTLGIEKDVPGHAGTS
jgi:hypothetical protein